MIPLPFPEPEPAAAPGWDGRWAAEIKNVDGMALYECTSVSVRPQQRVVVQHEGGVDVGKVILGPAPLVFEANTLPKVLRSLTAADLDMLARNHDKEEEALDTIRDEVQERLLPMHPVKVHVRMDRRKIMVYYVAEQRVDYRDLVRDLAEKLQSRIEFKQVGSRQASAQVPAIGTCGQQTCCSRWMRGFQSITLEAAREQNLTQTMEKIHGHCGRLKCCLLYEIETYRDFNRRAPRCGEGICSGRCEKGKATVVELNPLKGLVIAVDDEGRRYEIPLAEVEQEVRSRPWLKGQAGDESRRPPRPS